MSTRRKCPKRKPTDAERNPPPVGPTPAVVVRDEPADPYLPLLDSMWRQFINLGPGRWSS